MKKQIIFLAFLVIILKSFSQSPCKEVIGYYPNWQWYDRAKLVNPQSIDYEKYTIINYAFFSPQPDGSIISTDTWADENLLLGNIIWYPEESHDSTSSIIYLAHNAGCKILPSIGGWTLSDNFPQIAADPGKREVFINSCISLITTYNFDGIDIDWEYPGFAEHSGTPADKVNFTILMQELKTALDNHEIIAEKELILTACFSADPLKMQNVEYNNLIDIIDMFNMMTYDFSGTYDAVANHNSPLFQPAIGEADWNLDRTFYNLTEIYGVPANKINLGVAFYGKSMTNCSGLFQTHSGLANTVLFAADEGTPLYYNVLLNINEFQYNWDDQAKVPYLTNGPDNTFVTYDNEESVRLKGEFIAENSAGGAIIWEITGDYIESFSGSGIIAGTPLVDALIQGLCNETETEFLLNQVNESYLQPINNKNFVVNSKTKNTYLTIYDLTGTLVFSEIVNSEKKLINLSFLNNGIYLYQFFSENENSGGKIYIF
ncbi:MAG: T9SS type A sorting domain-containing protein [Bacteroidales bacterium]|nr:T9SS type A sorting domain-containing protein [Bacteroidales bacterium]